MIISTPVPISNGIFVFRLDIDGQHKGAIRILQSLLSPFRAFEGFGIEHAAVPTYTLGAMVFGAALCTQLWLKTLTFPSG